MELHWPPRASPASLNAEDVHLWAVRLDVEQPVLAEGADTLSPDEQRRAERFHFEHVRRRFIAAHGALRQLLGHYLGIEAAAVKFAMDGGGKPRIASPAGADATCDLRFNLSHSGELALVAIACGVEVGVDVEQVRAVSHIERLARRYFHAAEADEVLAADGDQRNSLFMRCWTAKEAIVKAYGSGIGAGLSSFRVPLDDAFSGIVDLSALPPRFTYPRCWVTRINPCAGYATACALIGDKPTIGCFSFAT